LRRRKVAKLVFKATTEKERKIRERKPDREKS